MNKNENCSIQNVKLNKDNYKRDMTICRDCYNKQKKNNTLLPNTITTSYQQPKMEKVTNNKNRTVIVGFSNCGKTYLMNYNLFENMNQFL